MNASDIMTKVVVTGQPDTTIEHAAELMTRHQISAIPILDQDGSIVGIVSEGDLMRRVDGASDHSRSWWLSLFSTDQSAAKDFVQERGRYLKNIMTTKVITVTADTAVGQIARLLEKKRIKRVPVIENGRLIGIVSRANLMQALASQPVVHIRSDAGKQEKRDVILNALAQVPGLKPIHLNVIVADNRVDVWGLIGSDDEEEAAKVALEAIDGLGDISVHFGRIPDYGWVF